MNRLLMKPMHTSNPRHLDGCSLFQIIPALLLHLCCPERLNWSPRDRPILAANGVLRGPTQAKPLTAGMFPGSDFQDIWDLAGARKPLQRRGFVLLSGLCRLGRVPGVSQALNGYRLYVFSALAFRIYAE